MHEFAVTQSMLDLVLEEAKKNGADKVQKINLVLGEMSGIVGDCLQFYFEFLSKGTPAEGASLLFRNIPTQARCRECGGVFTPEEFDWSCPECHKVSVEITAGKELYVESIEVE
jgi:hydrogenase nickel incorporation protein HypA/HybF